MTNPVMQATEIDVDRLILPLVAAFCGDPLVRWFLPRLDRFMTYFPRIARLHAVTVLHHGGAFQSHDHGAAALWYPPDVHPDSAAVVALLEEAVDEPLRSRVLSLFGQMASHKPAEPHWYLRQIGVDPALQGTGLGSALLGAGLAACDRVHLPAYLEASSPGNRALYERFGFVATGEIQAGDSPPMWPMMRPPR
jgi:GNAT superfamily N-acetyltransferase